MSFEFQIMSVNKGRTFRVVDKKEEEGLKKFLLEEFLLAASSFWGPEPDKSVAADLKKQGLGLLDLSLPVFMVACSDGAVLFGRVSCICPHGNPGWLPISITYPATKEAGIICDAEEIGPIDTAWKETADPDLDILGAEKLLTMLRPFVLDGLQELEKRGLTTLPN